MTTALALLFKPIAALLFFGFLLCCRFAVIKWFPEGRIKQTLLMRVHRTGDERDAEVWRRQPSPRRNIQ